MADFLIVDKVVSHACNQCRFMTYNQVDLDRHKKEHARSNKFTCRVCEQGFNTREARRSHYIHNHAQEEGNFVCPTCDKHFVGSHPLKIHMIIHTDQRPFKCDHEGCFFDCNTLAGLRNHKMSHVTDRPLKCPFCSYSHHVYRSFKAHVDKHLGLKPFKCDVCDFSSAYKNNLLSHIKSKHSSSSPSPIMAFLASKDIMCS